jgi:hypothetical protein
MIKKVVIPAKAGIQTSAKILDSRLHGNDKIETHRSVIDFEVGSS